MEVIAAGGVIPELLTQKYLAEPAGQVLSQHCRQPATNNSEK